MSRPIDRPATPRSLEQPRVSGPPRIVGIGASAGGLIALEEFLREIPPDSDLAYIVVQHLDPTQKAMLAALLQRVTRMPVRQAAAMMPVEPNCVYVIPPDAELTVVNGTLNLVKPTEPRGLRLPINVLFSSLARDQGERAIAVVLSGMGTDGTLGMQSIKAAGGLTLAQQPASAQFDSMPSSAIAAGCADIVAPAAELPARIFAYVAHAPAVETQLRSSDVRHSDPLQAIFELLHTRTGHDFSLYKANTIRRRIGRRMSVHGTTTLAQYRDLLTESTQEAQFLFKELLIGVTSFFRDPRVWQHLAEVTLPELLARRTDETKLRAWVAGCSTAEEAFSLAIVFAEVVERLPQYRDHALQVFATDLSPDAIAMARRGEYPASISADVSPARLARFFTAHDGFYKINAEIRNTVLCAQQDVVRDPPFTRLDILSCRNLLIYFDATLQRRLLPLFHYSLRPGGVLLLGSSETVGQFNRLFAPLDSKLRLYQRTDNSNGLGADVIMTSFPPLSSARKEPSVSPPTNPTAAPDSLQQAADHLLLQEHAPPAVVVNERADIVYISGHTGTYLEPAAGKANWNFHAMVREGLRAPIAAALKQAATHREPVLLRGLRLRTHDRVYVVDVTVQSLQEPSALHGMAMIVFRAMPSPARRGRRKEHGQPDAELGVELQYRAEIETLRAEARASREGLQSANEELQSTNEELQSANEELTTSKEEMQSMNEELQTVNAEMRNKLDDLALEQGDMKNVLNSTDIAILFLDQELNVRRYTDRAARIFNLRETDIGRPLSDLASILQYPTLHDDTQGTLRTLVFSEKQIVSNDGRWFSVRIMPYRRLDNVIDGAVITLVDITTTKELESKLRSNATA